MHLDAVCACVCATFVLYFTFYGLLFFFRRLFVHCILCFRWKANFPFSFFHFCFCVANQMKPRKIFSFMSSSAFYVCLLYFTPNTLVQHKQIKSDRKRIKQYERLPTKSCLIRIYVKSLFLIAPKYLQIHFIFYR